MRHWQPAGEIPAEQFSDAQATTSIVISKDCRPSLFEILYMIAFKLSTRSVFVFRLGVGGVSLASGTGVRERMVPCSASGTGS